MPISGSHTLRPATNALCACGCGLPAPTVTHSDRRRGLRKGDASPFILHHATRLLRKINACPDCGGQRSQPKARRCLACAIARQRAAGVAAFWTHVDQAAGPAGCWPWQGRVKPNGYGATSNGRRNRSASAHRRAYELVVGAIPSGAELDHLCHNADRSCRGGDSCPHRRCVNPRHLEPVAHRVNVQRGRWPIANRVAA